jgi:4-hydroxy-3-methylbut-2-enyl diphosphate reductase
MRISVIDEAGFCFGVKRATRLAFDAAKNQKDVYTLGPLIHNPQVVAKLKSMGIRQVSGLEEIPEGTLIVRSHGLHPDIFTRANEKKLDIIDATCPFVQKAQKYAESLLDEGYQLIVVGEKNHPEIQAIQGVTEGKVVVVPSPKELDVSGLSAKIGVIAQTTQHLRNLQEVVSELLKVGRELKIFNTICNATLSRQQTSAELAHKVDLMLVVGGRNSANTSRLFQICSETCPETYLIEVAEEINPDWIKGKEYIGVTAGASTPDWIISEVVQLLEKYN